MKGKRKLCSGRGARTAAALMFALASLAGHAQVSVSDDFTQSTAAQMTSDTNPMTWVAIDGACLTAAAVGTTVYGIPACVGNPYYAGQSLVGGQCGYLGSGTTSGTTNCTTAVTTPPLASGASAQLPDPPPSNGVGYGALRLTNGKDRNAQGSTGYYQQHGAIISSTSFPGNSGVQIIFKAIAYSGDANGAGNGTGYLGAGQSGLHDGADGMSFFLLDAAQFTAVYPQFPTVVQNPNYNSSYEAGQSNQIQWPAIGATGGSLGYTCSNTNPINDGMVGAYLGLGIDEWGNFLNSGDNTNAGVANVNNGGTQQQGGRIGLRGAGNISWITLSANYPQFYPTTGAHAIPFSYTATNPFNGTTSTYYPQQAIVQQACQTGYVHDWSGFTQTAGWSSNTLATNSAGANIALSDYAPIQSSLPGVTPVTYASSVVTTAANPGNLLAAETAATRGDPTANPIYYNLKITNDGYLTFTYSFQGYAKQVLSNINIAGTNGALPANLLFGFAGSTGGSDNVHEILCFKAMPVDQSDSSSAVTVPEDKVVAGLQVYIPTFHTNNWWGQLEAVGFQQPTQYSLTLNTNANGSLHPNWDASCVLTGGNCTSTGQTNLTAAYSSTGGRQILTWKDSSSPGGVAFKWGNLSTGATSEQSNLGASTVVEYLRGNRCDEFGASCTSGGTTTTGSLYRVRSSVLGDIMHSAPTVEAAPTEPYPNTWADNLQGVVVQGTSNNDPNYENSGTTPYGTFALNNVNRMNVAFVGSNDGMVHGFQAGVFNGTSIANNTGAELLAYVPAAVVNAINANAYTGYDYPSTEYAHSFFVDAPPVVDDLWYSTDGNAGHGSYHTWLAGGLGAGGSAIYVLDVTDPTTFSESNASTLVVGEWNGTRMNSFCGNHGSACGTYLQNTYGKPVIWRFHNGSWGMVFGNGLPTPNPINATLSGNTLTVNTGQNLAVGNQIVGAGITGYLTITALGTGSGGPGTYTVSSNSYSVSPAETMNAYSLPSNGGRAGIYIMLVDPLNGPGSAKFYYLDTGLTESNDPLGLHTPNGIAYVSPVDLDGDNIVDYVYAGDLYGNLWRFDVTSSSPASWGVSTYGQSSGTPLFSTWNSVTGVIQPITTKPVVSVSALGGGNFGVLVNFGTGYEQPVSLQTTPLANYAPDGQAMYGVWDWDMGTWDGYGQLPNLAAISSAGAAGTFPTAPLTVAKLQAQTMTIDTQSVGAGQTPVASITSTAVNYCYAGFSGNACSGGNTKFGWYLPLALNSNLGLGSQQQVIYNPTLGGTGILQFNTVIPPFNNLYSCSDVTPTGFSIFVNPVTGGSFSTSPLSDSSGHPLTTPTASLPVAAIENNGTGSIIDIALGAQTFAFTSTATGTGVAYKLNPVGSVVGHRVTWTQLR